MNVKYMLRKFSYSSKISRKSLQLCLSRSISTEKKLENQQYCLDQVKKQDFEGYLVGLLYPKHIRSAYFAVKAFNIEIATIKDQIPNNSNNIARIRFQFWRDILHEIQEKKKIAPHINQPVALELLDIIQEHNLTTRWFERSLEARLADITNNGVYEDYNGLEDYAELAHSSLNYLMLELLGLRTDTSLQYAASHLGVSTGITTLIRSHPYHASLKTCYFPRDVMQKFQVKPEMIYRGPQSPEEVELLKTITHDVASQAYAHLAAARKEFGNASRENQKAAIYAFLPANRTAMILEELEKHSFDPIIASNEINQQNPLSYQYRLLKSHLTSKI